MTILIVDDNEQNLYQLQVLLGGNGYQVVTTVNGVEGLAKARQNPPDLVISDILMPVMDGFTFCREWKKDERLQNIPFIFYTATYTDDKDREFALSLGAEQFLVKPEEPEVFIRTIREVIRQVRKYPAGTIPVIDEAVQDEESGFLRQYNEVLIRKLEVKMGQLEQANRELERGIADLKRTDEELQSKTALLEAQVNASLDGILVVDKNKKMVLVNRQITVLFNVPRHILNVPQHILYEEDDTALLNYVVSLTKYPEQFLEKVMYLYEHVNETSRDEIEFRNGMVLDRYSAPVLGKEGKYYGRIWTFRDITERKKAEAEKSRLEQQLMESQKMQAVGQLAGGISHDFNNLLSVINGYSEMLIKDFGLNTEQRTKIEEILRAGERASSLTRQLLAFSRRQPMEFKIIDINAIVSGMNRMLRRLVRESIGMTIIGGPDLWQIKADPSQIEQVIMNLVVNARDAMLEGGILTIKTENVKIDGTDLHDHHPDIKPGFYAMLSVSDTGCGMDDKIKEHMFEPFFTTKEIGKGTGLGLATVYGIVKQSNGFINVQSEPGKGTEFRIYFPQAMSEAAVHEEQQEEASIPRGNETILLVEDEENIRMMLLDFLQSIGYTVLLASNGKEALQHAESHKKPIHLLLADVVMPGMNGFELAKQVRKLLPEIKQLFMSGYTKPSATNEIMKINDNLIQKPLSLYALGVKIREILGRQAIPK